MTHTSSDHPSKARPAEPTAPHPAAINEHPLVDIRDMIVVHTAMLREFRLAPGAVTRVPIGAHRAARRINTHLQLMCDLLHHHHSSEDELLWPPLRALLSTEGQALLDEAEAQHTAIDRALHRVNITRRRWAERTDDTSRAQLVDALYQLHGLLLEHLDTEERDLLPLAAAYLTPAQWAAVGAAGAASVPASKMLLVFGMFAYEGDPEVVRTMLHSAPPPARVIVAVFAPRMYARYAKRIHGTHLP